ATVIGGAAVRVSAKKTKSNERRCASRIRSHPRALRLRAEVLLEQLQDPLVFVGPARRPFEAMVLHWIRRDFPVLFSQLDEAFGQPHGILKQNVRVDHAMTDEQRALESLRKIYRRALTVRVRIF